MSAPTAPGDVLGRIVADKIEEVRAARSRRGPDEVAAAARAETPPRDFAGAIRSRVAAGRAAVIAEIKKASPSKGVLREDFDPPAIARSYEAAGAACLSVLTDAKYFQGAVGHLARARAVTTLPALRKEFIVDDYQIAESRALGADAILLIAAVLDNAQLAAFEAQARELGMAVLVEVHDAGELDRALRLATPLVGINNRNLRTFAVSLATTLDLLPRVPSDRIVVAESGIATQHDVAALHAAGVHAFLVGEAFMRVPDPGSALEGLFGPPEREAIRLAADSASDKA